MYDLYVPYVSINMQVVEPLIHYDAIRHTTVSALSTTDGSVKAVVTLTCSTRGYYTHTKVAYRYGTIGDVAHSSFTSPRLDGRLSALLLVASGSQAHLRWTGGCRRFPPSFSGAATQQRPWFRDAVCMFVLRYDVRTG